MLHHPAVIVEGRLCRLVEAEAGRFTAETWAPKRRRWVPGGVTPGVVLLDGTRPTPEELRRLGLRRVPK